MERALTCSVILRSIFFVVSDVSLNSFLLVLVSKNSLLDFWAWKYVDIEFLPFFRETSANSSEMQYFLHINAKLFDVCKFVIYVRKEEILLHKVQFNV